MHVSIFKLALLELSYGVKSNHGLAVANYIHFEEIQLDFSHIVISIFKIVFLIAEDEES